MRTSCALVRPFKFKRCFLDVFGVGGVPTESEQNGILRGLEPFWGTFGILRGLEPFWGTFGQSSVHAVRSSVRPRAPYC